MSVMIVGLPEATIRALKDAGADISLAIYIHKLSAPIEGVEMLSHKALHHMMEGQFAPDLDEGIAAETRRRAMPYYRRTHHRHFRRRGHGGSWLDVENFFENALQYYWMMLRKHGVTTVLFHNVPHGGTSIILYHLCQVMGVRTVLMMQSLFPNGFFAADSIPALGMGGARAGAGLSIPVDDAPKPPHYMKGTRRMGLGRYLGAMAWRAVNVAAKTIALKPLWHPHDYAKSLLKFSEITREYKMHHLPQRYYSAFEPDTDYVYFPLHLQPEMTTDILGNAYCDQILAIEELARALPEGTLIYVKENPKQTAYMRDDSFFTRLLSIPSVRYLPVSVSSFALTEHSRAVATITGTVGWEAIQMGRPVICFGDAWYKGLPGVFQWQGSHEDVIAAALAHRHDGAALHQGVARLSENLWPGVIDDDYEVLVQPFDAAENLATVTRSIMAVLTRA